MLKSRLLVSFVDIYEEVKERANLSESLLKVWKQLRASAIILGW